jgi:outer membrane protein assembly factor BamB
MSFKSFAAVALLLAGTAAWADWTQFRGPGGDGRADKATPPTTWGDSSNVLWKIAVPGVAWSQPIVVGDKVFVTTAISARQKKPTPGMGGFGGGGGFGKGKGGFGKGGTPPNEQYRWEVHCLDKTTGKTLWTKVAAERRPTIPIHSTNTYATETPTTDGERLYVYFGMVGVYCYDLGGQLLWKKDLGSYTMGMGFGTGSSPVLADGRLFIQCDNEEKSFLIALDAKTGDQVWKVSRKSRSSWSTPYVWRTKDRTEVVACGEGRVTSYDPATGKVLWELGGFTSGFQASPAADGERIYFGNNPPFGGGALYAVNAGATGDITLKGGAKSSQAVAWVRAKAGPYMASPLLFEGQVYVANKGLLTCLDAKSGKELYKERLPGGRGVTASPWVADGKLFVLDEEGQTFVIQTGPTFKLLAQNRVDGGMFWASAAVDGDRLLLRGTDRLFCIGAAK